MKRMMANEQTSEPPLVAVVDDDDLFRRSILRLLRSSGLRAESFASAEAFLQSDLLGQTACLLLDVCMPGMGGLELQRLIKSNRQIPIIFLSARASEWEEKRAVRNGAAGFLRKPVSKEVLLKAIQSAFERPCMINDPSKEL